MKKKYINPTTEVIKVETQHMIALSTTESPALQGGEVLSRELDEDAFTIEDNDWDY